jgi:hypothetical protein
MFGKKVSAEATIISDEGGGSVVNTDLHGDDWDHHKYIVEVRPEGEPSFRAEARGKVCIVYSPSPGDVVRVSYDPKSHKTELDLDGDDRYNPKAVRAKRKAEEEAQRQALLNGAPAPSQVVHYVGEDDHDWEAPAKCPDCGAPIDPMNAEVADRHLCPFCQQPLPSRS